MIFITGGTGLIGSFLLDTLAKKEEKIKALYRQAIPSAFKNLPNIQWIKGDILDTDLLRDILRDVTQVYHCAGLVSYAPQDADLLKEINVTGTANIVDACLEIGTVKLMHVSSIAAIGNGKGAEVVNEKAKWDNADDHSNYASSKYFGELEVWRGITEGLPAIIVNPSVVLGPTQNWNRSSAQLVKYVADQKPYYTAGSANFVDVRDVVESMIELMASPVTGEQYILNAGQLSYQEFFGQVAACLQVKPPHIKVSPFLADILWRAEHVRSLFTGKRPLITRETARITKNNRLYSNEKIKAFRQQDFRTLPHTIAWCCKEYRKSK